MAWHCLYLIFSLHLHQIGCNSLLKYSTKFIELVGVGVEPLLEDVCAWMTRQLCVLSAIAGLVLATTIFFNKLPMSYTLQWLTGSITEQHGMFKFHHICSYPPKRFSVIILLYQRQLSK